MKSSCTVEEKLQYGNFIYVWMRTIEEINKQIKPKSKEKFMNPKIVGMQMKWQTRFNVKVCECVYASARDITAIKLPDRYVYWVFLPVIYLISVHRWSYKILNVIFGVSSLQVFFIVHSLVLLMFHIAKWTFHLDFSFFSRCTNFPVNIENHDYRTRIFVWQTI